MIKLISIANVAFTFLMAFYFLQMKDVRLGFYYFFAGLAVACIAFIK